MIELLNHNTTVFRGRTVRSELDAPAARHRQNVERGIRHFQANVVPVASTDIVFRLIGQFAWSLEASPLSWFNRASEGLEHLAAPVGISTTNTIGAIAYGALYGRPTGYVSTVSEPTDLLTSRSWEQVSAVNVLYRPGCQDPYSRPDLVTLDRGICLASIDIPRLAFQYKSWWDRNQQRPSDQRESTNYFVGRYVYTNAIQQAARVTLTNVVSMAPHEVNLDVVATRTPFQVLDQLRSLNQIYQDFVKDSEDGGWTPEQFIKNVPLGDAYLDRLMTQLNSAESSQNLWAFIVASIPLMQAALHGSPDDPDRSSLQNRARRYQRAVRSAKAFNKITDTYYAEEAEALYEAVLKQIG